MKFKKIAVLAALCVACSLLVWYCVESTKGYRSLQRKATQTALDQFAGWLTMQRPLPCGEIEDILDTMLKEGWFELREYFGLYGPFIVIRGLDAWGHRLVYERMDADHAVIRSIGPNGIDEHGKGDDIQLEIPGELGSEQ